jgi:alpha-1,3-rhamnosyl/mannosyltransferase
MLGRAARSCLLLCTVSRHTAQELERLFGVDAASILVLPNAPAQAFRQQVPPAEVQHAAAAHGLRVGDYLLTVGINKPHKNYPFVVKALAQLFDEQQLPYDLAMVGISADEAAPLLALAGPHAHRIRILGKLPFEQLPRIYAGARALVFPSLAEGFGLPVVEAQGLGVPVLASRASCVPEVAGDGAILFDPTSAEDFRRAIADLPAIDSPEWHELRRRGFENASRFEWTATARLLLEAWERLT